MANKLFKVIAGAYYVGEPLMIWGQPGSGKTTTIAQVAEKLGKELVYRTGNKSDPTDFSGIPYLVDVTNKKTGEVTKEIRYSKPKYIKDLNKAKDGILFFDELTTCPPSIQTPMLSIIQDCNFGEFSIPKTTFRIAAGNYNNVVGTHQVSIALMNRFVHFHHELSVEDFLDGFASAWMSYELPVINSLEDRQKKEIQYRLLVKDFIKANPDYMSKIPEDIANPTDVAFPTPRSWDMLVKVLSVLDMNDADYVNDFIDGTIGVDAGRLFKSFMKKTKKFDLDLSVYVGKESTFKFPNPSKHDEVGHIVDSIMYWINSDAKKYIKLWVRIMNLLHNKDNKFGKYVGYNGLIVQYISNSMAVFDKKDILTKDIILSMHGKNKDDSYTIDDFDELYITGANLKL